MSYNQDRKTIHPESQGCLTRLLAITQYSLASYLAYAPSWTHSGDEPLAEATRRIAAAQQAGTERVGRLLVRRYGYADSGRFPTRFTEYNDVALDYLARRLIEHERQMIDEIGRCAEQLAGDPEAQQLAEEALACEKRHLGLLARLAPTGGARAEGQPDQEEGASRVSIPTRESPGRAPLAAIHPDHGQPPAARPSASRPGAGSALTARLASHLSC